MAGKNRIYDAITEKAKRGEYTLVEPLDFIIMSTLHLTGTLFAGAYPQGHTASQISKEAFKGEVDSQVVTNRLKVLKLQELVSSSHGVGVGGNLIWQVTEKGHSLTADWFKRREG